MSSVYFRDINVVPPGGLFFYETHGERVSARTFLEIKPKVMALMEKYNIPGIAEAEVARYMCSIIPNAGAYCKGKNVEPEHVRPSEAVRNSIPYCSRQVVPFDKIEQRLRTCAQCKRHARDWCPTCTGHVTTIMNLFNGRRKDLPEDTLSGVCQSAKAYEIAIASIEYDKDESVWDGAPDTCWRYEDV